MEKGGKRVGESSDSQRKRKSSWKRKRKETWSRKMALQPSRDSRVGVSALVTWIQPSYHRILSLSLSLPSADSKRSSTRYGRGESDTPLCEAEREVLSARDSARAEFSRGCIAARGLEKIIRLLFDDKATCGSWTFFFRCCSYRGVRVKGFAVCSYACVEFECFKANITRFYSELRWATLLLKFYGTQYWVVHEHEKVPFKYFFKRNLLKS